MAKLGIIDDGVKGGLVEFGTFTLDPASLAAGAEAESTVTITGAKVGDLIFVNPRSLDADLFAKGARVSAADTVSVALGNEGSGATDGGSATWGYLLIHIS